MVGVGRDLCGSSSPTLLPKQGHLQQAAEDLIQAGLEYLQRRKNKSNPVKTSQTQCFAHLHTNGLHADVIWHGMACCSVSALCSRGSARLPTTSLPPFCTRSQGQCSSAAAAGDLQSNPLKYTEGAATAFTATWWKAVEPVWRVFPAPSRWRKAKALFTQL